MSFKEFWKQADVDSNLVGEELAEAVYDKCYPRDSATVVLSPSQGVSIILSNESQETLAPQDMIALALSRAAFPRNDKDKAVLKIVLDNFIENESQSLLEEGSGNDQEGTH